MTRVKTQASWRKKNPPYQVGRDGFEYSDVKKDYDGWVNAQIFHPFPYDLVRIKTEDTSKSGWWNGRKWEGYRLCKSEKVLFWKDKESL